MLGDGTMENRNVPIQTKNLSGIVAISSSYDYSLALDKYGTVWAWGRDDCGQLGDGEHGPLVSKNIPFKVPFSDALSSPAVEPKWMGPLRTGIPHRAEAPDNDTIIYMAAGNDGILYAFTVNGLTAFDQNSHVKWNFTIPGRWTYDKLSARIVLAGPNGTKYGTYEKSLPAFTTENGYVYLYAISTLDSSYTTSDPSYSMADPMLYASKTRVEVEKELIAVSPDGKISWTKTFKDDIAIGDTSHIEAHDGRIYLYHNYNETVFDRSGTLLFNIENVSDPVSVGDNGYIYAMHAVWRDWFYHPPTDGYFDYRTPSNVIEKYSADGQLCWRKELSENASRPYFTPGIRNEFSGIPIYRSDTLYVPLDNGIMALNKDGVPVWTKKFNDDGYRLFYLMPMDTAGNIYFFKDMDNSTTLRIVAPNGSEITPARTYVRAVSASNDVVYGVSASQADGALETDTVSAYDMAGGKLLWNFTMPIGKTRTVVVNESNVNALFSDYHKEGGITGDAVFGRSRVNVMPSDHIVYVYFRTMKYDTPVVLNQSKYTYASTLYALDNDGKLIWQKPMDSFVTTMAANNSTIYYSTGDGKIYTSVIEIAAGFAIIGAILVAAKLFLFGSVTRARSKIDKNDNRNRIYRLILERPGSTLYEISKEQGLNLGTVRYHLMILCLNHRIAAYNDDGKFVRYFTNSNIHSKEDQMVISLVRRESMGKILKVLLERDEATNIELSEKLGLPDSAISKYLGMLSKKGVIVKNPSPTIRASYSINNVHMARVANALRLIDGGIMEMAKSESQQAESCA